VLGELKLALPQVPFSNNKRDLLLRGGEGKEGEGRDGKGEGEGREEERERRGKEVKDRKKGRGEGWCPQMTCLHDTPGGGFSSYV